MWLFCNSEPVIVTVGMFRCEAVDKGRFTMQHESSDNELVAGQCRKFHANSAVVKSTAAAAISNARLTA